MGLVRSKIQGQHETLIRFSALPGARAGVQKLGEERGALSFVALARTQELP